MTAVEGDGRGLGPCGVRRGAVVSLVRFVVGLIGPVVSLIRRLDTVMSVISVRETCVSEAIQQTV